MRSLRVISHFILWQRRRAFIAGFALFGLFGVGFLAAALGKPDSNVVRIGAGRLNSAEWISTLRHKTGASPQVVCVSIALATRTGGVDISEASECASVRDNAAFIQSVTGRSRRGKRTVFTAVFSPAARKVAIDLGKDDESVIRLKRLASTKARQLGVDQVGYWVHAYAGPVCLKRITSFDKLGNVLSNSTANC